MIVKLSPAPQNHSADVAAVDLGSNSFHMLVARADGSGLRVVDRLREPVRLAAGLDANKHLLPETADRALSCLSRFGERLRGIAPDRVRVVGTNTLRKMRGRSEFLAAAEAALGHEIEIIPGREEARLVYSGVVQGLGRAKPRRLVVDIGGGSTELIIGTGAKPRLMESVSLGCVTHTLLHFRSGEITREGFDKARLAARVQLEFLERRYRRAGWDVAVGASGTIRGVWRVLLDEQWCEGEVCKEGLEKLIEKVVRRGHVSKMDFPALREDRRPVFPGGLAVLAGVFDALDLKRMRTSEHALREGVVHDLLGRLAHHDVRAESVQALAKRYGADPRHAAAVGKTALKLLGYVAREWDLDDPLSPTLLGWAAQLHEIGLLVSHASYHKHGEYVLRHCDLQGFSQTDLALLAALVRLHRGKFSLSALEHLPDNWKPAIQRLAILLRLAVLLHRSRAPDLRPPVRIAAEGRDLELQFTQARWLERHPLTRADLESESEYLRAIPVKLRIA